MEVNVTKNKFTESELEAAVLSLFEAQGYANYRATNCHSKFEDNLLENDMRSFLSARYTELTTGETLHDIFLAKICRHRRYSRRLKLFIFFQKIV